MKLILLNPYYDEEIEVKENLDYFNQSYENVLNGNEESIRLTQTSRMTGLKDPDYKEKVIFINPRHWAKVELIDDELVEVEE